MRWLLIMMLTAWVGLVAVPACDDGADGDAAGDGDADVDADANGDADGDWTELNAFVEEQMELGAIPGLALAIVAPGQVLWSAGYGLANIEEGIPVETSTSFQLASVSKTFVAVAVMQLVEAGVITLDDPVNDHLPFVVDNPLVADETIRILHLATHTSGIVDNWDVLVEGYVEGDSPVALGDFLAGYLVAGGDTYDASANFGAWRPGETWDYGNVATALAGYVVEVASGPGFDTYCDANIFEPLGLDHTSWRLADLDPAQVAMPYWAGDSGWEPYGFYGYPDYPDGLLRASVDDVARFLAAIMNGGEIDEARVLDAATVEEMLSPQIPDVDETQGVWWYEQDLGGRTTWGHNGGEDGVATDLYFEAATGIGVVLLMNTDWTDASNEAAYAIELRLFEEGEAM